LIMMTLFSATVVPIQAPTLKRPQWTIAVYLDSDNNLDDWAQKDVNEMMMVGSTKDVNVLVLWDRSDGPAHAYRVLPGALEELRDYALNGIETNMGDPATLRSWVTYSTRKFPSEKYMLLCYDHGDDFRGCMYDEHIPDEGFDLLTHQEVVSALSGFHIDILAYSACVLQTIEVSYEYLVGGLDIGYYVANEGYDPMDGFPYDTILAKLVAKPAQSPLTLSNILLDDYIDYYQYVGTAYSQAVTLSVVDISKVGKAVTDLRSMTEAMMGDMYGYANIVSAASGNANLPWSEHGWERLIDLPTFVSTVHAKSLNPREVRGINPVVVEAVVSTSGVLMTSLNDTIIYRRNVNAMEKKGCIGISIYFPTSQDSYENNKHLYGDLYPLMAFADEGWLDFMFAYWKVK